MALPKELQQLENEFLDMKKDAGEFLGKIKDSEFNKRPDDGGWSIAECIDHLIVTGVDYCDTLEKGIKQLAEKNIKYTGEMKHSWVGQRFVNSVEPPVSRKFKSPAKWRPASKINKTKVATAYLQLQDRYIDLLHMAEGYDLTKIKLPSPAVSWIKFRAFTIFAVNSAHQRRHLEQAKNTRIHRK